MDCFIKKIFDGKSDNLVHIQFQKFSRGEFRDKAMINASKVKDKISISTTSEYANELVRMVAEKITSGQRVRVTGAIVSTRDLTGELKFKDKKQFMGVKQYIIDSEMSGNEIIKLCDSLPTSFIALSFSVNGTDLKIKAKAPKSAKPSTGDKRPTPDFCKLKTSDPSFLKNFLFDVGEFRKVEISHDFIITELIIPKNAGDPVKMREMTIRKGKIVRKVNIDGKEKVSEKPFEA